MDTVKLSEKLAEGDESEIFQILQKSRDILNANSIISMFNLWGNVSFSPLFWMSIMPTLIIDTARLSKTLAGGRGRSEIRLNPQKSNKIILLTMKMLNDIKLRPDYIQIIQYHTNTRKIAAN